MKSTWLLALAVCACAPDAAFHCGSSEQCRNGDTTGTCEATGFCSFPDATCPSGSRYTTSAGGLSGDCVEGLSMGIDTDGDGVADAVDNCPSVPNPDQGNEDGDMYGDACDPCPPVADDVFVDSDGDGIDDQCDPHVGVQDHIVLFEGFHHGLPAAWTINGGTWVANSDGVLGTPPGQNEFAVLRMPYSAMTSVTISAGITPTDLSTTIAAAAGVVGAYDGSHVLTCELHQQMQSMQTFVAQDTGIGTTDSKPWTFVVDMQYSIALTYDLANTLDCYVERGTANTATSINLSLVPTAAQRMLGVYVNGMPARVDWIMLIAD